MGFTVLLHFHVADSVAQYHNESGSLLLTHHYPACSHQITARVNIDLVLESINSSDLQVGSWINVIGYICGRTLDPPRIAGVGETPVYSEVAVRAVMLWSAGDIKLKSYEDLLQERKDAGATG
jgi:hypothetical protein